MQYQMLKIKASHYLLHAVMMWRTFAELRTLLGGRLLLLLLLYLELHRLLQGLLGWLWRGRLCLLRLGRALV